MVCARCLVKWETITRGNYTWSLFEAHALCCHHFIYISFLPRMVDLIIPVVTVKLKTNYGKVKRASAWYIVSSGGNCEISLTIYDQKYDCDEDLGILDHSAFLLFFCLLFLRQHQRRGKPQITEIDI